MKPHTPVLITPTYVPNVPKAIGGDIRAVYCGHKACNSTLGLSAVPADKLEAFAEANGYAVENGKTYCSKRCAVRDVDSGEVRPGEKRPVSKFASPNAQPLAPTPVAPSDGARLKTWASGGFAWVQCGYAICKGRFEVPPQTDLAWRVQAAVAHGYVEDAHGVYCSKSCARASASDTAMQTKRETPPPAAAPVVPSRFVEAIPEDVGAFTGYARAVSARPADGRNVRMVLALQPLSVALVEYLGDEMIKAPRRRAVAWTGETVESACEKAMAGLPAFLAGQIGIAIAPGAEIVPQ